ncbi:MAG: ion transporter [Candidatus Gracilibacteria bacterium]
MPEEFKKIFTYNRKKYECILDDPKSKIGFFLDYFILILVLLTPVILIFESVGNNAFIYLNEIYIVDAIISTVFAFEYFYRFFESKKKMNFLITPMRIIDLLSFLPFFLGFITIGGYLKILRILRVLRILRLFKKIPLTSGLIRSLKEYSDEYRAVFTLYFIILFLGSSFVYYAEKGVEGTDFTSIPAALWWGLVTTTTVGYGDMVLNTTIGKLIGSVLVFVGPLLGGLISAVTIMVFMETSRTQESNKANRRGKLCRRCQTKNTKLANFCIKCGKKYKTIID